MPEHQDRCQEEGGDFPDYTDVGKILPDLDSMNSSIIDSRMIPDRS
jgi:hypothetical protein